MESLELGLGLDLVQWLQSLRTPAVEAVFAPFNPLGGTLFYLLLLPLLTWCVDASFGRRAALTFLVVVFVNLGLKLWWARPRPFHVSAAIQPSFFVRGPGIPSGHAMMAAAIWGMVAAEARRRWVTAAVLLYVFLMGLSRLVAGVHFPQDVLVGWLLGAAAVGAFAWLEPGLGRWLLARPLGLQIALGVAAGLTMLLTFRLLVPFGDPVFRRYGLLVGGTFLGGAVGIALERRFLGFSASGSLAERAGRFLLGGAVLVGLFTGARRLGGVAGAGPVAMLLPLVGYGLVGLWLSLGAPWLFVRLGWARREAASAGAAGTAGNPTGPDTV